MFRYVAWVCLSALGMMDAGWVGAAPAPAPDAGEATAIRELARLGAEITRRGKERKGHAVRVRLATDLAFTDAGLVHLKALPALRELNLCHSPVTDAWLVHLKGLRRLEALDLSQTKVTDAGLTHLTGLKTL